ncbi:hypothetical protein BVY02_01875 [bacterium J17]|nr:hypothetical protein BVY02_01875 [bacterium J17]
MNLIKKIITQIGFSIGLVSILGLVVVGLFIILLSAPLGSAGGEFEIETERAVGVVELSGEILSAKGFRESLNKQLKEDAIKAIVVRIDSPGGAVGASEEIFYEINRAEQKKPVVCSMGSVAASGGLYAAVGCDKILAHRGTITGSIGVILMSPNVKSLMDSWGAKMMVIKSGPFKDSGSPFRELRDSDREVLQSLVDRAYSQFVKTISESRSLDLEKVKAFSDGRVIIGEQAKELGLIDEIGGLYRAAKIALELAKIEGEPELIFPESPTGLMAFLGGLDESSLLNWLSSLGRTRLLYQML